MRLPRSRRADEEQAVPNRRPQLGPLPSGLQRFGLDGSDPKTLKEIGEMMSLSRERIRQIEAQALEKLHRSQKCQQLRGYLN